MTLVQDPLEQVLTAIQQRWGPDALRPLGELSTQQSPLPTGFSTLDALVGGWPRGRLSLVTGGPTAGLTTLGLHALAAAQREDRPALIVDVGRTLDPASAVRCGVDLEQVLLNGCCPMICVDEKFCSFRTTATRPNMSIKR